MKFQKTFLAASLAIAAATAQAQNVGPAQVTDGLIDTSKDSIHAYEDGNGNHFVLAPVYGEHATKSPQLDTAEDWLPELGSFRDSAGNVVGIDLGTGAVIGKGTAGNDVKYDVFKYEGAGKEVVYEFKNPKTNESSGYFVKNKNGELVAYKGKVDVKTLEKGGQIDGVTGGTNTTGFETKVVNGEKTLYGYQGSTINQAGGVNGTIVNPDGSIEHVSGKFGENKLTSTDIRYVQSGILANTGNGPDLDPSKNIYGTSARDNNNITIMTGNGIALGDLAGGKLQTDGSVISEKLTSEKFSGTQKTRQYTVGGKTVVEVYNDDKGRELESQYYEVAADGKTLSEWKGKAPTSGTHIKTGTGQFDQGTFTTSKTHNTVTNKNVTYSESVSVADKTVVKGSVTTPDNKTNDVSGNFGSDKATVKTEQSVSTGVIGKNEDGSNKYGTEVKKTDSTGKKEHTTITAGGIDTTGTINAKDYLIDGVSIVDNIKDSVDGAVSGVTEAIEKKVDAKISEVDEKIVEVDARLTQFGETTAALSSRMDQMNKRIDDVEKTAYRGVAIAMAAQQAIPNIGAGQTAVFGGVGFYESESAAALGLATVLKDGRTSFSGALGVAGDGEVGGRVGVAYVFGGK